MTAPLGEWFLPAPTKGRLIDSVGTKRVSVAGTSGAGKTYAVMRLCELLHERQSPFVVIDTVGNFWGLRVGKDGKSPGLGIPVLGGMHGDLELEPAAGELVAEFVQTTRTSLVLDVSLLDEEQRSAFVSGFARRLLALWKQKRQVLTVIVDEAQDIVPEVLAAKGDKVMRAAMQTLGLQGRNFGIGLCLVTQAPQNVLKRLFNLADLLIAGRLGGEHERGAIVRWVRQKGLGKDALDELAELPTGTLYAWSPSWLEFFGKVRTTGRWTLDSSKTPELGDVELEEGALAPVDLDKLGKALRALAKQTGVEDETPRGIREALDSLEPDESVELAELRGRVGDLEHENGTLWAKTSRLEKGLARAREALLGALAELDRAEEQAPSAVPLRDVDGAVVPKGFVRKVRAKEQERPSLPRKAVERAGPSSEASSGLDKAERTILGVLVWQKSAIPKARVALLGGYSVKGGGFNNALGRLRKAGRVEGSSELVITAEGRRVAPAASRPPAGGGLLAWWLRHSKVDTAMGALLRTLYEAGGPLPTEELQRRAGYKPRTGGVSNALGRLRTLGLVVGRGSAPVDLVPELRL